MPALTLSAFALYPDVLGLRTSISLRFCVHIAKAPLPVDLPKKSSDSTYDTIDVMGLGKVDGSLVAGYNHQTYQ
ncbi:hypothetical protein GGR52DRAFT_561407 [Hypoxylon sp. FL1284]|nr:hypothetical protein GGR52DRAFT_561407 [Hypoxylon sp. FL1284]